MSILFIIVCSLAYQCMKNKKHGILTGALHLSPHVKDEDFFFDKQEFGKLNNIKTTVVTAT